MNGSSFRHLSPARRRFASLVLGAHVALLLILASILKRDASTTDALLVAAIATLMVLGACAALVFLNAFPRTLVPGIAMHFIRGPEPTDPDEQWAWYWGRIVQLSMGLALAGAVLLWVTRSQR